MDIDKRLIAVLQEDFPICARPYKVLADKLKITEAELILHMTKLKEAGQLRKIAAVLNHRELGFTANALCAWEVEPARVEEVGRILAKEAAVTHCYARAPQEEWPYNLNTMLHAKSEKKCTAMMQSLANKVGVTRYILLFSIREWKKSSMRYV